MSSPAGAAAVGYTPTMRRLGIVVGIVGLIAAAPARAELNLPKGFSAEVYVTGQGFDSVTSRGVRGIPSASTMVFDGDGALYVARTGRRYMGGEVEDVYPIYRFPLGGARFAPDTERRFLYGPPLPNPQVGAMRGGRELFVTTFDRDRRVGVLYRVADGRAALVAGGTPDQGAPLLRQPEGAAVDSSGNVYVADRLQATIVRLDPTGRVVDARWFPVQRPRALAVDSRDRLWIAADGPADAPWQRGPGEIWRVETDGTGTLVMRGPISAGLAVGPGDHVFVGDRQSGAVFALAPDGRRVDFATYGDGDAPRGLAFAPDTPRTRAAGIAGGLFVITIRGGAWPVNSVMRILGPFDDFLRDAFRPRR